MKMRSVARAFVPLIIMLVVMIVAFTIVYMTLLNLQEHHYNQKCAEVGGVGWILIDSKLHCEIVQGGYRMVLPYNSLNSPTNPLEIRSQND